MTASEFFKWDSGDKWDTKSNIRTEGGIVAGNTTTDPAAGQVIATDDIKTATGLAVGSTSDNPVTGEIKATTNIKLDGGIRVGDRTGTAYTDDVVIDGGLHVGGSPSDPVTGNITAKNDVLIAGGAAIGDVTIDPSSATLVLADKASNPVYSTTGHCLYSRNKSLLATDQDNNQYNLTGAGYSGFLVNNFMRNPYASWTFYSTQWGAVDHGPGRFHLTDNGGVGYEIKPDPGYMYCGKFDGVADYYSYTLTTGPPNSPKVDNWFTFGIWVKFTDFTASHGIISMGSLSSSDVSWWINHVSGYIEFGYLESGTYTARTISIAYSTTDTWVFIGAALGHGGTTFDMFLQVNDTELGVDEIDYPAWNVVPNTSAGNLIIGYSGRGWYRFKGIAAAGFLGGNSQEFPRKYYEHTRGYFNI